MDNRVKWITNKCLNKREICRKYKLNYSTFYQKLYEINRHKLTENDICILSEIKTKIFSEFQK